MLGIIFTPDALRNISNLVRYSCIIRDINIDIVDAIDIMQDQPALRCSDTTYQSL